MTRRSLEKPEPSRRKRSAVQLVRGHAGPSILNDEPVYAGFDLSLAKTGYCILQGDACLDHGRLMPNRDDLNDMQRLAWIRDQVLGLVDLFQPAMTYLEAYAFSQAARAHQLGELGGVVRLALAERYPGRAAIAPIGVNKKHVSGKGNSPKELLIMHVFKKWGFEAVDNNEADGYALARLAQSVARGKFEAPGLVLLRV